MNQISLVDINQFYIVPVKKRGNYKKHPKPEEEISPWTLMKDLYVKLAGYFSLPVFCQEDIVFTQGIFRISCYVYTDETYEYQGETFKGENFKVFEAEIIGTENMYLEDRLKIHQAVLSYLDAGVTIEETEKRIKSEFKEIFKNEQKR